MDGLVVGQLLVVRIGDLDRAVLDARAAPRALVLDDAPGLLRERDREVSGLSFDAVDFRVGEYLDVGVSVALDELRRFDAHGAVVGGKGLVELRHLAADGRQLLDQVDLEARGGKVQGGLNAADPTTDHHDVAEVARHGARYDVQVRECVVKRCVIHFVLSSSGCRRLQLPSPFPRQLLGRSR